MTPGRLLWFLLTLAVIDEARIISVPDLHGDWDRTVLVLSAAKLIDPKTLEWTGGHDTLVQTGDITDRGVHTKQIYQLFQRLGHEAHEHGGAVINLMGNHELMNLQGDLRYVVAGDYEEFGGESQRENDWSSTGWLGQWVRNFPAATKAGGVLFVHAGVLPDQLQGTDIAVLNKDVHAELEEGEQGDTHLLGDSGPLWTREYGEDESGASCADARDVLRRVGATRMVVGHTPHTDRDSGGFRVGSICDGHVLLADTAISYAYGGEPSYLEHDGEGGAIAVYPRLAERHPLPDPPKIASPSLRRADSRYVDTSDSL